MTRGAVGGHLSVDGPILLFCPSFSTLLFFRVVSRQPTVTWPTYFSLSGTLAWFLPVQVTEGTANWDT